MTIQYAIAVFPEKDLEAVFNQSYQNNTFEQKKMDLCIHNNVTTLYSHNVKVITSLFASLYILTLFSVVFGTIVLYCTDKLKRPPLDITSFM